jgi:anhydro-N-acetylmuramic acid kinase
MVYHALGLMSGSSLDGLDLVFAHFHEQGGQWTYEIEKAACYLYSASWENRLKAAPGLPARDYCQLHVDYGHYLGQEINRFIDENNLHYKIGLIGSHGHTGDALAAETGLPVISDLRSMDLAYGGQGAPLVPMGERSLFSDYSLFLNIGGIANITKGGDQYIAFDICPANRVLNLLANKLGKSFDENGAMAAKGIVIADLLSQLNAHPYYKQQFPKSLANELGTDEHFPLLLNSGYAIEDLLATYTQHVAEQIAASARSMVNSQPEGQQKMLVTGGGALNKHLIESLVQQLQSSNIEVVIPDEQLVQYKEALIMAFLAVLRWRQEYTVLPTVTGARRASIGGAFWNGQEA